jgi:hypothetical protein
MIAFGWINLIVLMKKSLPNPSTIAQKLNFTILDVNFIIDNVMHN